MRCASIEVSLALGRRRAHYTTGLRSSVLLRMRHPACNNGVRFGEDNLFWCACWKDRVVDRTFPQCARNAALSPVYTCRRCPSSRPDSFWRHQPQTFCSHAHSSFSVRVSPHASKKILTHYLIIRYELPGTAVLKAYKHGIHEFLNLPVSVFTDRIAFCCQGQSHCIYPGPLSVSVYSRPSVPTSGWVQWGEEYICMDQWRKNEGKLLILSQTICLYKLQYLHQDTCSVQQRCSD